MREDLESEAERSDEGVEATEDCEPEKKRRRRLPDWQMSDLGPVSMASLSLALELCLSLPEASQGPTLMKIHDWRMQERPSFWEAPPRALRRLRQALRSILRNLPSKERNPVLGHILEEGPVEDWRLLVLRAASLEVPETLSLLPDMQTVRLELRASKTAVRWWQALLACAAHAPMAERQKVLEDFASFARTAKVQAPHGRRSLFRLAALAASQGLLQDARVLLKRLSSYRTTAAQRAVLVQLMRLVTPWCNARQETDGCSLLARADAALWRLRCSILSFEGDSSAVEDVQQLASNPLFSDASRAALRCHLLLARRDQTVGLQEACQEAAPLAAARVRDLPVPLQAKAALAILPVPRCLFGVFRDLEVSVMLQESPRSVVGEPFIMNSGARRRHAKAVHEAWHSTRIVARGAQERSWTLIRRQPSHLQSSEPPLAFSSSVPDATSSVEVHLQGPFGSLAFGRAGRPAREWAGLHSPHLCGPYQAEKTSGVGSLQVYCDLDGVLADFNKGCLALFPEGGCIAEKIPTHTVTRLSYEEESEMWRRVESKSDFFLSLDWTSDGQELWRWIDWNVVPPAAVLTGLPLGRAGQMAAKQKEQWCLQRLGAHVSVFCCGTRNKQKFSGPNCVLIDDRNDLREAWEARGGVFIHHTSAAESIRQLKEVLLRGAEKNRAVNHMPLQLTSVCWASQTPAGCFKSNCRYLHVPISRRHRCWIQLWGFVWWRLRLEELAFGSAPLRGILWLGSDAGVAFWWSTRLLLLLGTYFFTVLMRTYTNIYI
ncbi:unnamed protein product [Effrenium voratum]|uniref:C3H1-type domain-containing protein n=1 Tax=Effrenium voratum TaxID=2562239 RepID=A0AA36ILJ2_9DINO|nr:unnamed protein product [Effrenium voratum]